ncbi:MAG: hypothetical protein AAF741_14370 [Bacteroidota bacterium]
MDITLNKDYREFIDLLNVNQVRYLVVGGFAVNVHGYPRFTGDIDFEQSYENRYIETFENTEVSFLDISDLITAKEAAARPQDLADAYALKKLQKLKSKNQK